jgi:hypothetical protein
MVDLLKDEQKKSTGSESSKMYLQDQIDAYEAARKKPDSVRKSEEMAAE